MRFVIMQLWSRGEVPTPQIITEYGVSSLERYSVLGLIGVLLLAVHQTAEPLLLAACCPTIQPEHVVNMFVNL